MSTKLLAGAVDWKMEVDRLNRLLVIAENAHDSAKIKAAIRAGFAKQGLKAARELVDAIAEAIIALSQRQI